MITCRLVPLCDLLKLHPEITSHRVSLAMERGLLDFEYLDPEPVFAERALADWLRRGAPTDDLDEVC